MVSRVPNLYDGPSSMMASGPAAPSTPRIFLLVTALVTGAIVMALEILGSRLLAPTFGNSLYVWGALIGIILAAMSSGYAFGGWASDRYRVAAVLAWLLLGSGAWTLLMPRISPRFGSGAKATAATISWL